MARAKRPLKLLRLVDIAMHAPRKPSRRSNTLFSPVTIDRTVPAFPRINSALAPPRPRCRAGFATTC